MRRIALGLSVGLVIITGVLVLVGGPREGLRAINDARALAALPMRPVAPMIALNEGRADVVVFMDGDAGWFELDIDALLPDTEIGMHGPRLFDSLTGNTHVPLYCWGGTTRAGKVLWAVRDGQIEQDYAFCNPRRMDVGPLRPFAEAVEMVQVDLPAAAIPDLRDEIASDPDRALISGPRVMLPYTDRYIITPPLMWYVRGDGATRFAVEQAIEAQIIADLGEAQLAFRRRPSSNPNLTYRGADGQGPEVSGMAMVYEGTPGIVPGVWGEPYEIWIDCMPESCARLEAMNDAGRFADLFEPGRDLGGLRAALRDYVPNPTPDFSPTPFDWYPTLADLEATTVRIAPPIPITYDLRYIIRPQSD